MFDYYYLVLRNHLQANVPELKNIDWYLGQYLQLDEDHVPITPSLYIKFNPVQWETFPQSIQRARAAQIEFHLVNETAFGDERDMIDTDYINHIAIERKIFQALMNARFKLSEVPGMENLADTPNDCILMESLVRTQTQPHDTLDNLVVTIQTFVTTISDYTAIPNWQQVMATLECILENE